MSATEIMSEGQGAHPILKKACELGFTKHCRFIRCLAHKRFVERASMIAHILDTSFSNLFLHHGLWRKHLGFEGILEIAR